jgi:two-component system, OmpR family, sensor histidine kinase SenX3
VAPWIAAAVLVGLGGGFAIAALVMRRRAERTPRGPDAAGVVTVSKVLQAVVSAAPLGVVVVDQFRDVVVSNRRAGELSAVRDGLLDDRVWEATQCTLDDGEDVEVDLSAPRGAADRRSGMSVQCHVRLLNAENPRLAVIYLVDQSEQARMEASRRDFVANVSHELKTPVAAMGVLAEALLESTGEPENVRRFAGKIHAESQRLASMVGELIELSRLQGAERLPDLVEVDVDSVVQEAISRHKVAADSADITIDTDLPSGLQVLGDQPLLVTALANLISNAIAYSPNGSTVSVSRRDRGDAVEIAVTDRGIGIALADQERVFERFFRADKARSRSTGGTGLGLAIVKHVAANHNGAIRLWSRPGTGSTFTLSIPAYHGPDSGPDSGTEPDIDEEETQ